MSMASALNNAVSGLTASSRMAEIVSSNTANAMTEGYARRELSLSSDTLGGTGGGVRVLGIVRVVNETLLQDKRLSDAASANATARTDFFATFEGDIGDPETTGSLNWTLNEFESALLEASSMPESTARLSAAVSSAVAVVDKINALSDGLQQTRLEADNSIAKQVTKLNDTLEQVESLNRTITTQLSIGRDASGLMDQRQSLLNDISSIVPIRVVTRDNNQVALFTTGGAILLDGNAVTVGFTGAGVMSADMTLDPGVLSGLTINGRSVSTRDSGALGGGTLGAAFAVRDELAPEAQGQLDAVARNLIERFQSPSVDSTLASGDPGLFTDFGNALDTSNEQGLAGRLRVNATVIPAQGGEVWRLRDGLNATAEGAVGDARRLNLMSEALSAQISASSGKFGAALRSASGLASDFLSYASAGRQSAELTQGYALARQESLTEMSLADGVDSDYEMQTLLQVEQAYAANARVIQTIDEMMRQLLDL